MSVVLKANKVLGPWFITKYGAKQGVLVLSKQIPLGIGIGVGAAARPYRPDDRWHREEGLRASAGVL